jgi:hypothetical protein
MPLGNCILSYQDAFEGHLYCCMYQKIFLFITQSTSFDDYIRIYLFIYLLIDILVILG